ncbi:OprD family outer membrane porin [Sulfurovum sp. XTW-4]|uniref:OprD family outer membrane porin n=1 Tax=Sulfurovum xiamenensis TaxID=3019066 RepID=A0ABT7QT41_9BACT|nr:OprD family outer membrane porin [Sulfurovum xiamenensis]MDM5264255.1 OprD family outer membrane porin [Sulfurovum xiamenensis]
MKWTKLSLVAALAVSSAVAGGDIAPVEPVVEAPVVKAASATTVAGKLTGYYITDDSEDIGVYDEDMFGDHAQLAFGATLDVSHSFTDWLTANFSAVGYINTMNEDTYGYFESGDKRGAFFQIANLTATYEDTTLVAGRQLLGTPMLQGYDWLLAPGAFEAYTVMNSSIENVTLVGSYVTKHRANNSGEFGDSLDGDNWTIGAAYDDKTISGSVWYYDIEAGQYSQVYVDLGYDFGSFKVEGQYVDTSYDTAGVEDATAFGIMASTSVAGFDLSAAYNRLTDNGTGYVGWNGLYTNQWNLTVADQWAGEDLDAFKVAAATTIMDIAAEVSYADYDNGSEFDLILGYDFTDAIDAGIVYTNTEGNYDPTLVADSTDVNQFELYVNYKF